MMISGIRILLIIGAASVWPADYLAAGSSPAAQSETRSASGAKAAQALTRVRARYGSESAFLAARDFNATQEGYAGSREQTWNPAVESAPAPRRYKWWIRSTRSAIRRDGELAYPGGVLFSTAAAQTPSGGWSVDVSRWRTGDDLSVSAPKAAVATKAQWERAFPHLALEQARLSPELSSGDEWLRYRDAAGETVELTLSPITGLVMRAAVIKEGPPQPEIYYEEYARREGVMMPNRTRLVIGSQILEDLRLVDTRLDSSVGTLFQQPAGYREPPKTGEASFRQLAPQVYLFDNMPGNYHSVAVDQGSHFVLLEAPQGPAYAEAQLKLLKQIAPDKPVRYVLVTHHHSDHVAGLKSFVDAGATLIIPEGAEVSIKRQLAARGVTAEPTFETVRDRRSIGTGPMQIDLYAFGSNHTASHLMFHLPAAEILFQGDLFYVPERGKVPAAFVVIEDLAREIARHRIAVSSIVGVHGRAATYAEFEEALRAYRRTPAGRSKTSRAR
jgi:glyoxylase-like metal-dependent hydrolase (beta-lactamase superfamily II)